MEKTWIFKFEKLTEYRIPNYLIPKRPSPKHITWKLSKINVKERIVKAAKEKKMLTYKENPIGLSDFSAEAQQAESNIQIIERGKLPAKNNIFSKSIL